MVISGGGYRVKPFKFYFHQEGVIDKRVFDGVVGGTLVKFSDILWIRDLAIEDKMEMSKLII